jgi:hypothetical protein
MFLTVLSGGERCFLQCMLHSAFLDGKVVNTLSVLGTEVLSYSVSGAEVISYSVSQEEAVSYCVFWAEEVYYFCI